MAADPGIQIQFTTRPDATGVVSGMELAREMIADAYRLLAPYAGVCPACADDLFTYIANEEIENLHAERRETGVFPTLVLTVGETDEARRERFDAHLEAQRAAVSDLLAKQRRMHASNPAQAAQAGTCGERLQDDNGPS
jgi:hypothetical protein